MGCLPGRQAFPGYERSVSRHWQTLANFASSVPNTRGGDEKVGLAKRNASRHSSLGDARSTAGRSKHVQQTRRRTSSFNTSLSQPPS